MGVTTRRRLAAVLLAALAVFGIALAVGASSGGTSEPSGREGSEKISVPERSGKAVRLASAGALPALRKPPAEAESGGAAPTTPVEPTPEAPVPTEPTTPVEPTPVEPTPPPPPPPDDPPPVVVD